MYYFLIFNGEERLMMVRPKKHRAAAEWEDLRILTELVEAEAEGRALDRDQAFRLATDMAERYPDIRANLALIRDRMRPDRGFQAASR